jgi:hypothetical protein
VLALQKPISAAEQAYMSMRQVTYRVQRPSTGPGRPTSKQELSDVYRPISIEDAKLGWDRQYETALTSCMHGPNCHDGGACAVGRRKRTMHLIGGSLLPIWSTIERVLRAASSAKTFSLKVTRIKTKDGSNVVGIAVPGEHTVRHIQRALDEKDAPPPPRPGVPIPPVARGPSAGSSQAQQQAKRQQQAYLAPQACLNAANVARNQSVPTPPPVDKKPFAAGNAQLATPAPGATDISAGGGTARKGKQPLVTIDLTGD